ncbi:MAG: 23S rRNA (pseudouridine(1915)-N(3))-methyltransferase RlmH, partial [Pseudomonadota bacterium]
MHRYSTMRLTIAAMGRLKPGPEQTLINNYARRIAATGRSMALGPLDIHEIDERKARDRGTQSARLMERIPAGATSIALDERGKVMTSPEFAKLIE